MDPSIDTCDPRRLSNLLDTEAVSPAAPLAEGPGTRIGRYKLLQLIGEGGFGSVFMAEQETPVVRKVALKIIKLGMDTKQVIARFEAERQALAMMDHPNIAKVLDAGATQSGRPYFVMELVKGIPITEFCDEQKLTARQRLELFVPVCSAVQHAHQKGIIHRDLKPNNVLVTMFDDKPVPVIIDFGIVKAAQGRLTDGTLFTEFRQFIGTPAYMSPEQAQMSALDVDTRSDIYSLGVLLYELLTGATPVDANELRSAAHVEMQRIIREVEPLRPSTRWSAMAVPAQTTLAARRRCDPKSLGRALSGDLDWIVMKCLEKDRSRRYETANGLARDLQRHLNNEPIEASPPSATYRLRKTLRRHKRKVAAIGLVFGVLVLGIVGTTLGLIQARRNLAISNANIQRARDAERREAAMRTPMEARLLAHQGWLYARLGQFREATDKYKRAAQLVPNEAGYWHDGFMPILLVLGDVEGFRNWRTRELRQFGRTTDTEAAHRVAKDALAIPLEGEELKLATKLAERARDCPEDWYDETQGMAAYRSGRYEDAIAWFDKMRQTGLTLYFLTECDLFRAMAYQRLGNSQRAQAILGDAVRTMESEFPKPGVGNIAHPPGGIPDWMLCQVLRREAETLICPGGPATRAAEMSAETELH